MLERLEHHGHNYVDKSQRSFQNKKQHEVEQKLKETMYGHDLG